MADQLNIRLASNVSATEGDDNISLAPGELDGTTLHLLGGNDVLNGSADSERVNGNKDSDNLFGGGGADTINGGKDNDELDGGDGNDVLLGDRGSDILSGGNGADRINGGKDDDNISGGAGNDMLSGDLGSDTLTGGGGSDVFMLRTNGLGTDFITDFQQGSDRLQLPDELNPNSVEITVQSGNSVVSFNGENLAILDGISTISTGDFVGGSPSPSPSPNPSPTPPTDDSDWLSRVNSLRSLANLPPVTENPVWSDGAVQHSQYLVKNNTIGHEQDPNNPWYTPEGAEAGRSGNVTSGSGNITAVDAIDGWMVGPFHGIGIIDPQLTQVAFGSYQEPGNGSAATLDVLRGLDRSQPSANYPIMWPANGQTLPLTEYGGRESPDPLSGSGYSAPTGTPIYLQIGSGELTPNVTASSFMRGNTPLDHIVFDETSYTNPSSSQQTLGRQVLNMRDAIVIMPEDPLIPGETYSASITANGETYAWSFGVSEF